MSDNWINNKLAMNCVAFDSENKEHVLISNGSCMLDHSGTEGYRAQHIGRDGKPCGCLYAPSEAIAIRLLSMEGGKPLIAWTYRRVNPAALSESKMTTEEFTEMMGDQFSPRSKEGKQFIGRV